MKVFALIVVFISVSIICLSQKICTFKVKYVDKEISTPYRISCDNFEPSFSKIYKEKVIKSQKLLDEISWLLENVSYSKDNGEMDVRTKLVIYFQKSKKQTDVCLDSFDNIVINGKPIKKNKKLYAFINLLISEK